MNFTKKLFLICFLKLLFVTPRIKSKLNHQIALYRRKNRLPDHVVNVISNCYLKKGLIILSGNWSNHDITSIIDKIPNAVIPFYTVGLEEDLHFQKHKRLKNIFKMSVTVIKKKKYPGHTFLIMIYDVSNLLQSLIILKKSLLWNHVGDFLIVYKNTQDGCQTAHSVFELVWSYRILSAAFLCYDEYHSTKIYTFNPYTNSAPKFWSVISKNKDRKSNMTLYYRSLDSLLKNFYDILCQKLFFDKTVNLGGSTVKAGAYIHDQFLPYDKTKSGLERFGGLSGQISSIIWNHLNATVHIANYSKSRLVDDNALPRSFLRDLLKGKIEITLNINLLRDFWKLQTYPQESAGFCIVSRKYIPPIKLEDVPLLQPQWFIIYCLAYFCLLGSLKYVTKRSYSFAFLESIRTILNSRMWFKPMNFGGRTLLINFMLIAMLIRIYFQSYLTSFNVAHNDSLAIDTDDDLIQSDLDIYGALDYEEHLADLDIKNRYRFGEYLDCLDRLLKGGKLICLAGCYECHYSAAETEALHISETIRKYYLSFSTSEDWPLLSRFNKILRSLSEAGLILFIKRKMYYSLVHGNQTISYPKLSWANVRIIWYFWLSGLVLASMVFLTEISLHKMKTLKIFI